MLKLKMDDEIDLTSCEVIGKRNRGDQHEEEKKVNIDEQRQQIDIVEEGRWQNLSEDKKLLERKLRLEKMLTQEMNDEMKLERDREAEGLSKQIKKKVGEPVRGWCFTWQPASAWKVQTCLKIESKYMVFGLERAKSGMWHIQGFVYFFVKTVMRGVKEKFGSSTIHLEPERGTLTEASNYCKKDGAFMVFGTQPMDQEMKGLKGIDRWVLVQHLIKKGMTLKDLVDVEMLSVIEIKNVAANTDYYKSLEEKESKMTRKALPAVLENMWEIDMPVDISKPFAKKCHFWIYSGVCDTGKSTFSRYLLEKYRAELWQCEEKYQAFARPETEIVILDAFSIRSQNMFSDLEKLCDGTFPIMRKGEMAKCFIKRPLVIVTSNYTMKDIFSGNDKSLRAMQARFRQIVLTKIIDNDLNHQLVTGAVDKMKAVGEYNDNL